MAMHRSLDSLIPQNERKEISWFLHKQNKELQNIRNEILKSTPTDLLWWIIIDTKQLWIQSYNDILKKRNIKTRSHTATKIKRIIKAILCFYQKEKNIGNASDEIEITFKEKNKEAKDQEARIKQEKIMVGKKILEYLEAKDKQPFGIFKTYFLEANKEWLNFHESADYATKKICEIYRREYNDEVQELFNDRAWGNNYLKEEIDEEKRLF